LQGFPMRSSKPNLLVGTEVLEGESLKELARHSTVFKLSDFTNSSLAEVLPKIDALLVFSWPKELTSENLEKMTNLKFVQSILAGVNHIPFTSLSEGVRVSSNAGAYSEEVAEYAWALLLAAAKRVVQLQVSLKEEKWTLRRTLDAGTEITILHDKVLGILGLGGIGNAVAKIAKGFQVQVYAYARKPSHRTGIKVFSGDKGLQQLLRQSDAVILALPLTNQTTRIIDDKRLSQMKSDAILVNIARGELVDEKALYDHLTENPTFRYATDVWWYKESRESLKTDYPFLSLPNFIGTPHVSGPSGSATGRPARLAVDNTIRFLKGLKPKNIVDPKEYLTSYPY
jgi:phosphoglycerate dehydrogenase-like enzyme